MDLRVTGSRPNSGRPQVNPITGEEIIYTSRTPRQRSLAQERIHEKSQSEVRPDLVPPLNLGRLGNREDEKDFTLNFDNYIQKVHTPNTASTVSWGTPYSTRDNTRPLSHQQFTLPLGGDSGRQSHRKPVATEPPKKQPAKPSAWDKDPLPENLPPPSQRYQHQYDQIGQQMKNDYKQHSQRGVTEADVTQHIERLHLDLPLYTEEEVEEDETTDQLQKSWTHQPYAKAALVKKLDREELEEDNRRRKLVETVLIDQLSRPAISYPPTKPDVTVRTPASYRPGKKPSSVRTKYDSSVRAAGSATENLLSRRIQFGARVLTRAGRDAIRELTGFFFAMDNSLTVYEFKKFGKNAKALPFIKRGIYCHQTGRRKDEGYTVNDIVQGRDLVFSSNGQSLPESMHGALVTLRITDVDNMAKAEILFEGVAASEQDEVWRKAHIPAHPQDVKEKLLLLDVQESVRKQIQKRGIKVFTGLGCLFHKLDDNKDGRLNKAELEKALVDYHIDIPDQKFDDLWEALDVGSTSFLEYEIFLRSFVGQMDETRKALVRKAFLKIDSNKRGVVAVDGMRRFYCAKSHPRVRSGESTQEQVTNSFLEHFATTVTRGEVTYWDFELYYEGLSVCVQLDDDFANILRNSWNI